MNFRIRLDAYRGPLDLLLHLVRKHEIDILDIPIRDVTDQFLAHLEVLQQLDVDDVADFVEMASTLLEIKSRLALPNGVEDEEPVEDARDELVQRLLEYKRYKGILDDLRRLEDVRAFMNPRGYAATELRKLAEHALADAEMESVTLYKLLRVFERLLGRFEEEQKSKRVHTVYNFNYTIQEQRSYLISKLTKGKKTAFESLFLKLENRIHAIVTFLALLELLNEQAVSLIQGEGVNNFWLTLPEET